jgi:uncharacterized protein
MEPAVTISPDHARRFLVRRHLLAPPRSLPAEPASVLMVVERLGLLQFDPIDVPGARSHDIALHGRIAGYRRGWCEEWLYGDDRRLIELYNKSLNILPMGELAYYRITWDLEAPRMDARILREQADAAKAILARIEKEGPLSTAAFADHKHVVDWMWAPTRVARAVMEALFVAGRLGIARREGNRRYYDLIERLVPAERLAERASDEAARRHRLLSHFRATGMTSPTDGTLTEPMYEVGKVVERVRWTAELVEEGVLLPLAVDGLRGTRYILAAEKSVLDAVAEDVGEQPPPGVTFVAPLDPLVWDRRLLRELWGFDWMWEIYVPEAKRRWGYYVLPILYGDRLVGRIEPRYERSTRTLRIIGISLEDRNGAVEDPRFLRALAEAVEGYRTFVGADKLTWPRSRPGRDVGSAIRRLG